MLRNIIRLKKKLFSKPIRLLITSGKFLSEKYTYLLPVSLHSFYYFAHSDFHPIHLLKWFFRLSVSSSYLSGKLIIFIFLLMLFSTRANFPYARTWCLRYDCDIIDQPVTDMSSMLILQTYVDTAINWL